MNKKSNNLRKRYKTKGGIWKCRNTDGLASRLYESTFSLLEDYPGDLPFLEEDNLLFSDGKIGYKMELADNTFFTIPIIYDEIVCIGDNYNDELVLGVRMGSLWGIYNGKALEVDCIYDAIGPIGRWFRCPVCRNGKWGVFEIAGYGEDKCQGEIVPCIYDGIDTQNMFTNLTYYIWGYPPRDVPSCLRVTVDGKVGLLDDLGRVAVPIIYDDCGDMDGFGVAIVCCNGKYGLVNEEGVEFVPCAYDELWYETGFEYIAGKRGDLWCIIGSDGKVITPFQYTALCFQEEYGRGLLQAVIDKENKTHLIDKNIKDYYSEE